MLVSCHEFVKGMITCRAETKSSTESAGTCNNTREGGERLSLSHHLLLIGASSKLELEVVLPGLKFLDFLDFGGSHLLGPTVLKVFIASRPTPRPKVNTTVNIIRGQSGVKFLKDIGIKSIVLSSSVKGVSAGTLLSPDVHTNDNKLVEKKIRDQADQRAGNARNSHIFQYKGVEI